MSEVNISDLKSGMVIAEDVYHTNKILLVSSGKTLNEKIIEAIKSSGYGHVLIEDPPEKPEAALLDEQPESSGEKGDASCTENPEKKEERRKRTYPLVTVTVSDDKMSAFITIEPQAKDDFNLNRNTIQEALKKEKVEYGIIFAEIGKIISEYNKKKRKISERKIAEGNEPKAGVQGDVEIKYPYLSKQDDIDKVANAHYAYEVDSVVKDGFRVDANDVVAVRHEDRQPRNGKDVFGNEIEMNEMKMKPVNAGERVVTEGHEFKACDTGAVCFIGGIIDIVPVNFNAHAKVTESSDKMKAFLQVFPFGEKGESPTKEEILSILDERRITFGIQYGKIESIVKDAGKGKFCKPEAIVKGDPPQQGKQGAPEFKTGYLSDAEQIKKASAAQYAGEITDIVKQGFRVDEGTVVAVRQEDVPPKNGTDIYGNTIHMTETVPWPIKAGKFISVSADQKVYSSQSTGVVSFYEEQLSVIPLRFDARSIVEVSNDKMSATLTIIPPAERGENISFEEISKMLKEKGVREGIAVEKVKQLVEDGNNNKYAAEEVIAEGTSPVHGVGGKVEFLIDLESLGKPQKLENGKTDYKNIKLVLDVSENQELARLIPPQKGKPGKNVLGETIPYREGVAVNLPGGINTSPEAGKEDVLVSTKKGYARLNGNVIDVCEGLVVDGDVDFSSGNIDYDKLIIVKGEVKSGFKVKGGADIEVGGTIEDAEISCNGNMVGRSGFVGTGKGKIYAKGNVSLAFIRNQEVKSEKEIFISNEVMNARLNAIKNIEITGAVGGKIVAGEEIRTATLGNPNRNLTEAEAGKDFKFEEQKELLEKNLDDMGNHLKLLRQSIQKIEMKNKFKKVIPEKEKKIQNDLKKNEQKLITQLQALEKKKEMLEKRHKGSGKAKVVVGQMAYAGTVILMYGSRYTITKDISGPKSFVFSKGKIKLL